MPRAKRQLPDHDLDGPTLRFPAIESLSVTGYELYPGRERHGLRCVFPKGVSAIVGINGIGKTTLLNICFRMLAGPRDWKNRQLGQPAGGRPIALTDWRDPDYFKSRVRDAAVHATARAEISIGSEKIVLARSLRTLAIEDFSVNGNARTADQKEYESVVPEMCGLASYEDFFLILRYLVFFLEDRTPLLWDVDAQREVLRALFFDHRAAERGRILYSEIQKLDSRYRNRHSQLAVMEKDFFGTEALRTGDVKRRDQIVELHRAARGAIGRTAAANATLDELSRSLERSRLALERAKIDLAEKQRRYAEAEEVRFADLVGRADEIAHAPAVFIAHALAGSGCLVCGSRTSGVQSRVRRRVTSRTCPFCAAPESEQERSRVGSPANLDVYSLDEGVQQSLNVVSSCAIDLEDTQKRYAAALTEAEAAGRRVEELRLRLEELGAALPMDSKKQRELQTAMKVLREQLEEIGSEISRRGKEYDRLLGRGETRIRQSTTQIQTQFKMFAGSFLAEDCDLLYDTERRRVGQGPQTFDFPRFQARMTSAGAPNQPSPRSSVEEVSESQKEFLDLSFRMAMLDVVGAESPVQLFLETPEASLDAVFTVRAGDLLGQFGARNNNRVVATSNLTNGKMVAALFGAANVPGETRKKPPSHYVKPKDRWNRVVDLIHSAAPNAAIRKYQRPYDKALREAIEPEAADGE
jgi:hypothetical protein